MSFRDEEDRRLWAELSEMSAADNSLPVPQPDGFEAVLSAGEVASFKEEGCR